MMGHRKRAVPVAALFERGFEAMIKTKLYCPFCHDDLVSVTSSGEEFTCRHCEAMVDILDADLCMVSQPPNHLDVSIMATLELGSRQPAIRR